MAYTYWAEHCIIDFHPIHLLYWTLSSNRKNFYTTQALAIFCLSTCLPLTGPQQVSQKSFVRVELAIFDRIIIKLVLQSREPTDNSTISRYQNWNIALRSSSTLFSSSHVDATVLLYSSHTTFSHVLDDPVVHGFHEVDAARKQGKGIWVDHLHPTSKMHEIVAEDIVAFLASVESPTAGA